MSAAQLYDLLKPHVTKLVVCDPRKNKSMREGNQNDKIDARRLAELLLDHLTPRRTWPTNTEGVGTQLSDHHQRSSTRELPGGKPFIAVGPSLVPATGLCAVPSGRVAREDPGTRSAPAGRVLLPTTRCAARVAPGSAKRPACGQQRNKALETALWDSRDRPHPGGVFAGHPADSASFSHQAAAVELRWFSDRDAQQHRSPQCETDNSFL